MESKQPMSWKLYRQELLNDEIDKEYDDINERINKMMAKVSRALVQAGLEPPSSLLNLSPPPSEDE